MITIHHIRGPWWGFVTDGFSTNLRRACKMIPGMMWSPEDKIWIGYADAVMAAKKAAEHFGLQVRGEAGKPPGIIMCPVASTGLRDYQNEGVKFLIERSEQGAILGDDVGLGKSNQAVTAARALKKKTVIVCPSFVRDVWLNEKTGELRKWWPAAKVVGVKGTKPTPVDPSADVVVLHFDIFYAWVDVLIAWGAEVFVIDEGHFLMGSTSRRTQAAMKFSLTCRYRIMLTATPMTSRPRDMWAPIDVISPGRVGKFFGFGIRYANGHQVQVTPTKVVWDFKGASNLGELRERLNYSPQTPWGFLLRRTRSDVALELPSRTRQFIEMEIPKGQVMATSQAIRSDRFMRKALDMAADGKFPQVIDLAVSHLEQGAKVAVGCYRREVTAIISEGIRQKLNVKTGIITGETPKEKRSAIIEAQPDLLVVTIDATKAGINLSWINVALVGELIWVPADLIQWEGRFARHKGRSVLIQYCLARGTVDGIIKRAVLDKLDRFAAAVGKTDDKLAEEMRALSKEGATERFRKLYERMKADDEG